MKRYEELEVELVIEFRKTPPKGEKYHLLFRAVPSVPERGSEKSAGSIAFDRELAPQSSNTYRRKHSVLVCVTQVVQGDEEIIPSRVWLEPAKKRINLPRNILASSIHSVFKIGASAREGEVSTSGIATSRSDGNTEHGVVQYGSKISNGIASDLIQDGRHGLDKLDLADKLAQVFAIRLNNSCVWVDFEEPLDSRAEITDVFSSPCEFAL